MARNRFLLPTDFSALSASDPILTGDESLAWEKVLLPSAEDEWKAMAEVGESLARETLSVYRMGRYAPDPKSAVALVGKGHNGGDALLGLLEIDRLKAFDRISLIFACSLDQLRSNTEKALQLLKARVDPERLEIIFRGEEGSRWLEQVANVLKTSPFDIAFDGLFGMQFRPPLREPQRAIIRLFNEAPNIRLRVAIDIPSGVGEKSTEEAFRADATFATGICKAAVADPRNQEFVGNIRYLDMKFLQDSHQSVNRALTERVLEPLRGLRNPSFDKRSFGHLFIVAGSVQMPGALAMCVAAAIQSGVGLITVFAPESHVSTLSCQYPEAMWIPWPESPGGGLALEGIHLLRERMERADTLLVGPGMGSEQETTVMIDDAVSGFEGSLLLDADALRPEVFDSAKKRNGRMIVTPHLGEYARLFGEEERVTIEGLLRKAESFDGVIALKGPNMRIADSSTVFLNTRGNAILARGGSGDILSGLMAGLLAMMPDDPLEAACIGSYWHGAAADLLALEKGQYAVRSTELLAYLSRALRGGRNGN